MVAQTRTLRSVMTTIRLALFLFQTVKYKTMRTIMHAPKMNGNHER
jgi:hypothetical protein